MPLENFEVERARLLFSPLLNDGVGVNARIAPLVSSRYRGGLLPNVSSVTYTEASSSVAASSWRPKSECFVSAAFQVELTSQQGGEVGILFRSRGRLYARCVDQHGHSHTLLMTLPGRSRRVCIFYGAALSVFGLG